MYLALLTLVFTWQIVMGTPSTDQTIYAELKRTLSSNHSHAGDRVELVVLEDWRSKDGRVLIPAEAKLAGTVVVAKNHRDEEPGVFSVLIKDATWQGGSLALQATIEKLLVMGVRHRPAADLPVFRGGNQGGYSATGNWEDALELVLEDCAVESVKDSPIGTAVVCHKRNVIFREGAQVLLLDRPNSAC